MAPKPGLVTNVIETLREPVREIKSDVVKQVGNMPKDLVRMLYVDPNHEYKTDQELEQIANREKQEKLEGFKQARQQLNALQGKIVTDLTIDDETRKQIEEEEKRLSQNFQKFEVTSKDTAQSLGQEVPQKEAQAEEQKEAAEEKELKGKKEKERANLENPIEAPAGITRGISFKRKRTPPRMRPPKSAETRANHE